MDITLKQMQIFRAVVIAGSITKASRRVGLSQPSISQQLAKLEERLGTQLINRNRTGTVSLTPSGEYWFKFSDDVLRKFAEIAQETTRTADVVGRLGGEEFAVLMPDTDRAQSGIAAERLREAVARRHFVTSTGALVPTTISVGVAHFVTGENHDQIIQRADEALYDAKHEGRNRTRLAA